MMREHRDYADIHGVPVDGCACTYCDATMLLIWSRSFLAYCGAPILRPGEWR
jgi:hypothetical protein